MKPVTAEEMLSYLTIPESFTCFVIASTTDGVVNIILL